MVTIVGAIAGLFMVLCGIVGVLFIFALIVEFIAFARGLYEDLAALTYERQIHRLSEVVGISNGRMNKDAMLAYERCGHCGIKQDCEGCQYLTNNGCVFYTIYLDTLRKDKDEPFNPRGEE